MFTLHNRNTTSFDVILYVVCLTINKKWDLSVYAVTLWLFNAFTQTLSEKCSFFLSWEKIPWKELAAKFNQLNRTEKFHAFFSHVATA